jgi:hypothetical protein
MTYKEVADKHGVSPQYVSVVCGKYNPDKFRYITEVGCVYPNWREWMNRNKVSGFELLRRMGFEIGTNNSARLHSYMRGETSPRKHYIDKLLEITGMSYECLFSEELWEGAVKVDE